MTETVLYDAADGIATVTLNRPERLNAMNRDLLVDLLATLEAVAADDSVRALILTGAGRGFCAGADLRERNVLTGETTEARIGELRALMRASQLLREMPAITIAAVNGPAAGAGLSLALAADLRYASESATFVTAFLTAGLSGDYGGTWMLPRIVGPAKARELYFLSDRVPAAEALRLGLVSEVVPPEALMARAREIGARLAAAAPVALGRIKANLNDADRLSFAELLDREADRHVRTGSTADAREAGAAFLEKRPPRFLGR